ncbi:hypothetical protein CEXT_722471 [Caerostris extrusa]|uniref:HSF-type DNA-binding domain-containing protein n=1 Tax=Caerostris extrusa TaxID=172846 RepID=A0AAV4TPQ6_CAEEX|nr:hypothetical protein CEXT_722471 [Caerostris extrusa]
MVSEKLAKSMEGASFPTKIFILAHSSEISSITWSKSGNSVLVHKINVKECFMPQIFNVKNTLHLYRQFVYYNFKNKGFNNRYWIFEHEFFKAGRKDLLPCIKRQPQKSRCKKKTPVILPETTYITIELPEIGSCENKKSEISFKILKKMRILDKRNLKRLTTWKRNIYRKSL